MTARTCSRNTSSTATRRSCEVKREGPRVNIDTGAYYSGRLTALRIWQNKGVYLTN